VVSGVVRAHHFDEATRHGMVLLTAPVNSPIMVQTTAGVVSIPDDFIVIDMADVLYTAGQYRPLV